MVKSGYSIYSSLAKSRKSEKVLCQFQEKNVDQIHDIADPKSWK